MDEKYIEVTKGGNTIGRRVNNLAISLPGKFNLPNAYEVGIDKKSGNVIIKVDPKYFRPAEVEQLLGDATKAKKELGWEPKTSFEQLVKEMCTDGI